MNPMTTGQVAELILAGETFADLFGRGIAPSEVFSAMVRLELSAHSNMPTRHRVARVDDAQVDNALAAATTAHTTTYEAAA